MPSGIGWKLHLCSALLALLNSNCCQHSTRIQLQVASEECYGRGNLLVLGACSVRLEMSHCSIGICMQ
jgi:hypothetical protein